MELLMHTFPQESEKRGEKESGCDVELLKKKKV
jgi:hypothetical protein